MTLGIKNRDISLASAILPMMALIICAILGHLAVFNFSQRHIEPQLSTELELVLPADTRQLLMAPNKHQMLSCRRRKGQGAGKWNQGPT